MCGCRYATSDGVARSTSGRCSPSVSRSLKTRWDPASLLDDQDFWITEQELPAASVHIAFAAPDRETVDAFHAAAVKAGGVDNGRPGLRPHYHSGYYAAFVLDPDGNNVEAVFHGVH